MVNSEQPFLFQSVSVASLVQKKKSKLLLHRTQAGWPGMSECQNFLGGCRTILCKDLNVHHISQNTNVGTVVTIP